MEDFPLSDSISIKQVDYRFTGLKMMIGTSDSKMVSVRGDINAGQFYDGWRYGLESETNFNLSSSFKLSAGYEFNALRFPDRTTNNSTNIHSVNARVLFMFSTKLSASLRV